MVTVDLISSRVTLPAIPAITISYRCISPGLTSNPYASQGEERRGCSRVALGHRRGRLRHLQVLLRGLLPWSQVPRRRLSSGVRHLRTYLSLPMRDEVAGGAAEHQAGVSAVSPGR